jgi:hypothetical protein
MKTSKPYLERHEWDLRLQVADCAQTNYQTPAATIDRSNWIHRLWQRFVEAFSGKTELQVWQRTRADGQLYWQAYDPVSGEFVIRGSEDEMRDWIETRYYTHTDAEETFEQQQYRLWALR